MTPIPTVISYFTRNTLYEKEAEQLRLSCEKAGLSYRIEGIDSFGKWHEHVCYKPIYILEKLQTLKQPVLWIDADGEVVQKPTFTLRSDIAIRIFDHYPPDHPSYLYAATIYFDYNPHTLELVKKWGEACLRAMRENPEREISDQVALQSVLEQMKTQVRLEPLPPGYAAIFEIEKDQIPPDELFIVQYQASRLYRKIINGDVVFGLFDHLSIEELRSLRPRVYFEI